MADAGHDLPDPQANFVWLPFGPRTDDVYLALERHGVVTRPFAGEGHLRLPADVGLLTNKRMAVEVGIGLAHLSGRTLSMPLDEPIGVGPGRILRARHRSQHRPRRRNGRKNLDRSSQ